MTKTYPSPGSYHWQYPRLHWCGNEPEFSCTAGRQPHLAGQNSGEEDSLLRRWHLGAPLPQTLHGARRHNFFLRVRLHWGMYESNSQGFAVWKIWLMYFSANIKGLKHLVVDMMQEFLKNDTQRNYEERLSVTAPRMTEKRKGLQHEFIWTSGVSCCKYARFA